MQCETTSLLSAHNLSLIDRHSQSVDQPFFLSTAALGTLSISEASRAYLSLIQYLQDGHQLAGISLKFACRILQNIHPLGKYQLGIKPILICCYLIQIAPLHTNTFVFVHSLPIYPVSINILALSQSEWVTLMFLQNLWNIVRGWKNQGRCIMHRGFEEIRCLTGEGFEDQLEQLRLNEKTTDPCRKIVSFAEYLISAKGSNFIDLISM
ncbi:hypothetical protein BLNAU_12395 [Blattamonas nauphoetae]|uniref:Uncharacterized protein n=1 Tax=Blattamonas nauphoetae TaxID=2049346 RepID=A0ABQ9XJZ2_9EUKA|nr:hypothetical protein BLNAU_12395 [Blattamonas nauphoetae]